MREERNIKILKVAYNLSVPLKELDPLKVNSLSEATLLRNLYSSLFAYDDEGQIHGDIAEDFKWKENKLVITMSDKLRTSQGHIITPEDVRLSLIRLMIDGNNLHGDLKDIICPGETISSWTDDCSGMEISQNKLILTPASKEFESHLIDLLASVDYRIIPKSSFDLTKKVPTIIYQKYTTGAYLVKNSNYCSIFLKDK